MRRHRWQERRALTGPENSTTYGRVCDACGAELTWKDDGPRGGWRTYLSLDHGKTHQRLIGGKLPPCPGKAAS